VSCTTRAPRPGEVDGKDYFFLSDEDFVARIDRSEFFEHAQVHGRRSGTLKSYVIDNLRRGIDVLMDIDVQGAPASAQLRGWSSSAASWKSSSSALGRRAEATALRSRHREQVNPSTCA